MNLEQIHENDVPALTILLSQCKLNSIFLHGKTPEKNEFFALNKNKSLILKKSLPNSSTLSLTDGKSKKPLEKPMSFKPETMEMLMKYL